MTIWHSKDELPTTDSIIYTDDGYLLYFEMVDNPMTNGQYPVWSYNGGSEEYTNNDFKKWCYLDDLLSLEQRLKDAEDIIEYISYGEVRGLNITKQASKKELKQFAQEYLNKYKGYK